MKVKPKVEKHFCVSKQVLTTWKIDEEMLRGEPLAAVVGNYSPELEELKGQKNIYFAEKKYAGGILEAIEKYDFIEKAKK